ncbi:LOW QUALITY PROTEIN: pathogenesis-related homeodomain protein-like [Primulina eburnea]|uniref:LOW QUALITY PROTEIN: pathogenesis-related homeodomain protein-like n=1 Tax=Primulina eburnea TaxID=1245227 RepID=UPI003C6BD71C
MVAKQVHPRRAQHSPNGLSGENVNVSVKKKLFLVKAVCVYKAKSSKKRPSMSDLKVKIATFRRKESVKSDNKDARSQKFKRGRNGKKGNNHLGLDEASRLQRRTRYLLIKIKLEQNLIDAYSAEGWKGQSREKIKPETELQRAKKQILKCKLGIREVIHQLDLLSSVGCINNSKVAPDGSVHHEHIICSKCELRDALPDNDIILCDGTCNRAFHQKCLDPPLSTENIPPEDEGWFCRFCESKMEILEATNAHLGTNFSMDSNWQDVFKEEAALPDGGNSVVCHEEEWPSDDSEDDDYDPENPERIEYCYGDSMSGSGDDDSGYNSSFPGSLEDEALLSPGRYEDAKDDSLELNGLDSDEINAGEILCRPRQRAAVDYTKLYDEMFGNNALENEQISEDEDWGPTKGKRKRKEADAASTLMTLGETNENILEEVKETPFRQKGKRSIFRLPHNAVEKLRLVFAENELPVRAVREGLSKQLGLEFEKVNKWFKNARYMALKVRKARQFLIEFAINISCSVIFRYFFITSFIAGRNIYTFWGCRFIEKKTLFETASDENADQMAPEDNLTSQTIKTFKKYTRRRNNYLLTNSLMKKKRKRSLKSPDMRKKIQVDFGDDESLKHLREKAKQAKKRLNSKNRVDLLEAEADMERLCQIKNRVEKLRQSLLQFPCQMFSKTNATTSSDSSVIYIPVAEVREKR